MDYCKSYQSTVLPMSAFNCVLLASRIFVLFLLFMNFSAGYAFPVEGLPVPKAQIQALELSPDKQSAARLMEQGAFSFRHGAFAEAKASYEAALGLYEQELNQARQCEALIMLSQASHFAGQYKIALESLNRALPIAWKLNDRHKVSEVLSSIGNAHIGLGNTELALKHLQDGMAIAKESGCMDVVAAIRNNLGNLYITQHKYAEAQAEYLESAQWGEKTGDFSLAASSVINGAMAAMREGKYADASSMLARAAKLIPKTRDSYAKAYSLINAGMIYSGLREHFPGRAKSLLSQAYKSFNEALGVARSMNDLRTVSYTYGYLGKLYEDDGQFPEALELTRRAVFSAQQKGVAEALYRWHRQCGRILGRMGKTDEAIVSYRLAIRDLQTIREELSSCYANPDSSYQKTASIICSELVDLLLQRASRLQKGETIEPYLDEARETLETLKVFELRDYFKDDCIDAAAVVNKKLDAVSGKAVVFYPILLHDRVELLVSFSGHLKKTVLPIGVDVFTSEIREFRKKLEKRTTGEFLPHAQKLYDWLIRPFEKDLDVLNPDTLVFVPDGALRTIPMAALHDGNRFLISRYQIAITPGLNLTDPRPLRRENARMLSMGVTQAVQGFSGLPYVSDELKAVNGFFSGHTLINEEFRLSSVEKELKKNPFNMVHIASHGQFGGERDKTFLLAFDEKLSMDRFGEYVGLFRFREEPLDLLTLSACETAAGDDQAALGLAGVAVRAGARSALATLWHVNDPASYELIAEFYRQLQNPSISRAAALQAAQLKLIGDVRYNHPGYWAPFLMINNWL